MRCDAELRLHGYQYFMGTRCIHPDAGRGGRLDPKKGVGLLEIVCKMYRDI